MPLQSGRADEDSEEQQQWQQQQDELEMVELEVDKLESVLVLVLVDERVELGAGDHQCQRQLEDSLRQSLRQSRSLHRRHQVKSRVRRGSLQAIQVLQPLPENLLDNWLQRKCLLEELWKKENS